MADKSKATLQSDVEQDLPSSHSVSRRHFLTSLAATAGTLALGDGMKGLSQFKGDLPSPDTSGIEHVVVAMMENRSYDHFLGLLPGADGRQAGLSYTDKNGVAHATHPLAPDYQGCSYSDPDHSYAGGRAEYNQGACDGWLRAGANDIYSIGYYTQSDLSFLGSAAPGWTTCDRYFAAIMSETYPNRIYQHAAQTDRIDNSLSISSLPTIWDKLAEAGVEGRYYYSDTPFLALWGFKYYPISYSFGDFLSDCASGNLPPVSFVDPRFLGEESGTSGDDHPHADIRNGEAFLDQVYKAVTLSPAWPNTLLIINYDEWGGFFDHVAPTPAPIPPADKAAGNADGLRGFRVPCLLVSPWSPRGGVSSIVYDHTSILNMIEWRWGVKPLTVRDSTAANIAEALDFRMYDPSARQFYVPPGPFGSECPEANMAQGKMARGENKQGLRELARKYGWPVY